MGMTGRDVGPADGLGLADAIGLLRDELLEAQAAGAGSDIQLPVESMTVVLKVTATRSVDGKAGFKVPIVELELGGGAGRERGSEQTVTVVFGGPVDRDGRPVKVAQESAQREGLSSAGGWWWRCRWCRCGSGWSRSRPPSEPGRLSGTGMGRDFGWAGGWC